MKQSLYQKYRPQNFSQVIGQENIVKALSGALTQDRIGHAYLFTGPRGTGKTTLARIFAKALNCQKKKGVDPCGTCESCIAISEGSSMNLIEIDAASHTGVDNIRQLREEAKTPPINTPYKVYIVDEVHMLSTGAFNALLKILEEPPAHVLFILATTDVHKVPETILSRCQRYDLTRLTLSDMIKKLEYIAKQEKVTIDKKSLEMVALAAEGGMRNAESLLSQIFSLEGKKVTLKETQQILGVSHKDAIHTLINHIIHKDPLSAINEIDTMVQDGVFMERLLKDILGHLRHLMLLSINPQSSEKLTQELSGEQIIALEKQVKEISLSWIVFAIDTFLAAREGLKSSFMPQLPIETAIVKIIYKDTPTKNTPPKNTPPTHTPSIPKIPTKIASAPPSPTPSQPTEPTKQPEAKVKTKITKTSQKTDTLQKNTTVTYTLEDIHDSWTKLLQDVITHHTAFSAFLSNCSPVSVDDGVITVVTKFSLYKEKLTETNTKLTIEEVLGKIVKEPVTLTFLTEEEFGEKIDPHWTQSAPENTSLLEDATEVFGTKPASSSV